MGNPMVDHLLTNAQKWGVEDSILALKVGVPETYFATNSFDFVYATTALEMLRESQGAQAYSHALAEIYRVLKSGGILGLGEPMHLNVEIPPDLAPYIQQSWKKCFRSLEETLIPVKTAGFEIIEAEYAPDAQEWWMSFASHDPFCKKDPDREPKTLEIDNGRWISYGYVICRKPFD